MTANTANTKERSAYLNELFILHVELFVAIVIKHLTLYDTPSIFNKGKCIYLNPLEVPKVNIEGYKFIRNTYGVRQGILQSRDLSYSNKLT